MTTRLLPPGKSTFPLSVTVNGRTYTAAAAGIVDVPDCDAMPLAANGWSVVARVGTTSQRPLNPAMCPSEPFPNQEYVDTTLGAVIVFDGATWRNVLTGAAV